MDYPESIAWIAGRSASSLASGTASCRQWFDNSSTPMTSQNTPRVSRTEAADDASQATADILRQNVLRAQPSMSHLHPTERALPQFL
jgi:hypothetical protein